MDIAKTEDYDAVDDYDDVVISLSDGELEEIKKALEFYCESKPINEVQTVGRINRKIHNFLENNPVKLIAEAAYRAVCRYDSDSIDVIMNEETDEMEVIFHSDNNSFTVEETGVDFFDLSDLQLDSLEAELDGLHVGHCW